MKFEIKKFNTQDICEYDLNTFLNFGLPQFIYGDLIALGGGGKMGCLNKVNGSVSIPFKYDDIEIAKNGIIKAISFKGEESKDIDFYDITGKYLAKYHLGKEELERESYFVEEDDVAICVIDWQDFDEDTYSISTICRSILADGTVLTTCLNREDKKKIPKNNVKPIYVKTYNYNRELKGMGVEEVGSDIFYKTPDEKEIITATIWALMEDNTLYYYSSGLRAFDFNERKHINLFEKGVEMYGSGESMLYSEILIAKKFFKDSHFVMNGDHLVMFYRNYYGLEICFERATKRKFFETEEKRETYLLKLEESVLEKFLDSIDV